MKIRSGEGTITAKDGLTLFYRSWIPERPRGVVVIVHGLGEHGGRYDHVGRRLADAGFVTFAGDHRGHGRSGGKRGHVDRFDQFLDDLALVMEGAAREAGGGAQGKRFLVGHSLGGLVSAVYACERPEGLSGLVTSSAGFRIAVKIPAVKAAAGKLLSRVWPTLTLSNEIDVDAISRDRAVVEAYKSDPFVHDRASTRFFTEFLAAIDRASAGAPGLKMPCLVLQAAEDRLVAPQGSRDFFSRAGSRDKQIQVYEGLYHEIFNEPEKERVLGDLVGWLEEHC